MNHDEHSLGGRLPLLKKSDLDGNQLDLYDAMTREMVPWAKKSGFQADTEDGCLIGPFNPLLFSPQIGKAFMEYLGAEREHTSLSAKVREVIILSVGAVWHSAYELYAHTAVAEKAGLDQSVIETLANGQTPQGLSSEEQVAHEFARSLAAEHTIDAALYQRAEDTFTEKGIADMIHLTGLYMATSAMLNAFAVPVPETEV